MVAYRRLSTYDPSRPIRAWLAGISIHVALDHLRIHYRRAEIAGDGIDVADHRPSPESQCASRQEHLLVLAALEELAIDLRIVFVLKELDGLSMPEIAAVLPDAPPINTLYSRLRLARERFAAVMKRLDPEGAP